MLELLVEYKIWQSGEKAYCRASAGMRKKSVSSNAQKRECLLLLHEKTQLFGPESNINQKN